jgi:tRNA(Ile)-lysidine synthase
MKNLLERFTDFIKRENLFELDAELIIAASGGIDSAVLCDLCHKAGYKFKIAHCNFQLRGEESERDEEFVKKLAEKFGVELFIKKFETEAIAKEKKKGIQETARELRYFWFVELWGQEFQKTKKKLYFLTGHHANDNMETMLMNFFKGTGINGLKGILPKEEPFKHLVRPLLFAKKTEVREYGRIHGIYYVEDSSNASIKYTRNYFRNLLIPSIQTVFPNVEDNLIQNLDRFRDIHSLYNQAVEVHKKKLIVYKGDEIFIPVLKLKKSEPINTIVYEIIKDFGFTSHQAGDVVNLLDSESGKYVQSQTHRIIKNRAWLIITSIRSVLSEHILIEKDKATVYFQNGKLEVNKVKSDKAEITSDANVATLDAKDITFPLLLRKWEQGDYFYPLGMNRKKKKLSKFFIDQKLSIAGKEKVWVIESDKMILWVVGMRIDERFKITDNTKDILKIEFNES